MGRERGMVLAVLAPDHFVLAHFLLFSIPSPYRLGHIARTAKVPLCDRNCSAKGIAQPCSGANGYCNTWHGGLEGERTGCDETRRCAMV